MSLMARDRQAEKGQAGTDDAATRHDQALDPPAEQGSSDDADGRQGQEAAENAADHGGPAESVHSEESGSVAQAEGSAVDTDGSGQGDAAVTLHRSPRWYFSGRLKLKGRNRGASKPAASMAAAALRKLFRGDRHRLSTGANHNEPKKKSAEGGSRLLSMCAGKASSERGQGKAARKPAEGASPRAPGSPAAAGGGGDTAADAAVSSSRTARSPRNRVAPCSQQAAVRARRLMRELQEIRRQQTRGQQPSFTVDLVEDNLYEWHVRLYQVDPESPLWRDMQESGVSCVQLSVSFPENFPFAPPFVRVLAPHIERGFVMEGGAICMELLTPRGWASAYTVEAILVQVAASLSKGQARIATKPGKQFNRKLAESSFRSLVKTHDKYGWVTPPLADG
ncbi:ubiquitin-conjugating enzyme E2Q-like protein CG4502 isoform X1 [Dermacentor albipictus]|uniref:ubiquitin-conjugating enzyme E2Q-like protein CG4502 isoform X1 n=2 Tax=Dermacentor albipictus TaxID=60249 RepID=UPI0038FC6C4C